MYKINKDNISETEIHYSNSLKFLWEQYLKFIHLGIIFSGITIGIILKEILFTKQNELNQTIINNIFIIKISLLLAALAGLSFILCRWSSQILMERQIYGDSKKAKKYFLKTNTILPSALELKMIFKLNVDMKNFLYFISILNEIFLYVGTLLMLSSWSILVYAVLVTQKD
jgi:hypothetical protein